jgi:hypothetical protein
MEKSFLWFIDNALFYIKINRHDTAVEGDSTVAYIVVGEIS